jgi:hypothetical protein
MTTSAAKRSEPRTAGKLRIGDDWNAIRIIALSQSNPLKAVAEFVENSIDAHAKNITLIRGKEKRRPLSLESKMMAMASAEQKRRAGFQLCRHSTFAISIKRRLKAEGATGLQGEFGIGLLSFWTVGEELIITSAGADGKNLSNAFEEGRSGYRVTHKTVAHALNPAQNCSFRNILPGIKQFSGEKIQWYLASELRDRIRQTGVQIRVIDRTARAEFKVEPRKFEAVSCTNEKPRRF